MITTTIIKLSLLSLALAADAMTVASGIGTKYCGQRPRFRIAFHFGLFQALFPLAGALLGQFLFRYIETWDHWLVCVVLSALGIRMIYEAFSDTETADDSPSDLTRGWALIGLSTAVSIDAFGAGITLPDMEIGIGWSVLVIGIVTTILSAIAMRFAAIIRARIGQKMEAFGGCALIAIGIHTVIEHMAG